MPGDLEASHILPNARTDVKKKSTRNPYPIRVSGRVPPPERPGATKPVKGAEPVSLHRSGDPATVRHSVERSHDEHCGTRRGRPLLRRLEP
jgi:hypothetical protein